ncbi:MAG: hypothetical protein ACE5I1_02225 [bacterium]
MWQLLKAEFIYSKLVLVFAFSAVLLITVLGISSIDKLDWMPWLPFFIIFVAINGYIQKEKRYRLLTQLPVKTSQIAIARITLLYLVYFGIAIFWFPPFMTAYNIFEEEQAWAGFASSIMLINVFAAALIYQDIKYCRKGSLAKYWLVAVGYATLIVLLFVLVITYQGEQSAPLFIRFISDNPVIPVVCILPIPLLYLVSIATYARRKSYLEERARACG